MTGITLPALQQPMARPVAAAARGGTASAGQSAGAAPGFGQVVAGQSAISQAPAAQSAAAAAAGQGGAGAAAGQSQAAAAKIAQPPDLAKIAQSAQDFESMAINELLKPMFDTVDTSHGAFGGGEGEEAWKPMMVQEFAKNIAANGGLGLAKPVYDAMLRLQELKSK